jgi:hypothetical protein
MVNKTRKLRKDTSKALTIPELRRAFNHVDSFVEKSKPSVAAFRKEWKKTFGKDVSESAAKDYLAYMAATAAKHKKKKSQKGGAALALSPAALGYDMTSPSTAGAVHSPPYNLTGMDSFNRDSLSAQCGKEDITPVLPATLGSNSAQLGGSKKSKSNKKTRKQKGGAFASVGTALSQFFTNPAGPGGSPPSFAQDLQLITKGYNGLSSPRPEINHPSMNTPPTIYNGAISPVSRAF